ncbi:hypothetical protein M569_13147 [Genlisea aurea]|uniref:Uncharacterized protein n=1 Tax=Genlisea aurea TaxID=192259 RepID=S8C4N7_9LAMI|nr:hypothetical protein M569_13147 [Genlisea aurea]
MSLNLLQSYSSAEEEEDDSSLQLQDDSSSDVDTYDAPRATDSYKPLSNPNPRSSSSLPSAFDAFSEVTGPPQFLKNSVQEGAPKEQEEGPTNRRRRNPKDLPAGAVVESKPQLVGIHERVRSDVGKEPPHGHPYSSTTTQGAKRVATAQNPNAEDAAELLRMCLRCGVPKTYTHGKGIVCPVCKDRPAVDSEAVGGVAKKKGSAIKDKEKSKRMKGQSSHATWKSETEMQLRQQFD